MKKLERYLLLSLIIFLIVRGFSSTYQLIWFLAGLHLEWWVGLVTSVLGILSAWRLLAWVERVTADA